MLIGPLENNQEGFDTLAIVRCLKVVILQSAVSSLNAIPDGHEPDSCIKERHQCRMLA